MELIERYIKSGKTDTAFAQDILIEDLALSADVAGAVIGVMTKYVQVSDEKLRKAMSSKTPVEVAKRDFASEVVSFYKILEDEPSKKDKPRWDIWNKSRQGFFKGIRNLFTSFYGRIVKKTLFALNGDNGAIKNENKEEPIESMEDVSEEIIHDLTLKVQSMAWGKSIEEVLGKYRNLEKTEDSPVVTFMRSALYSDYLSADEARLKFVVALQLFIDYYEENRDCIGRLQLFSDCYSRIKEFVDKDFMDRLHTVELTFFAIGFAMRGCDVVSEFKYNAKVLQIGMLAKELLGDEDFIKEEGVFA